MKSVLSLKKALLFCTTILLGLTFTSWKQHAVTITQQKTDTVPVKPEKKIKDIDDALFELDKARADLDQSVKDIDWEKIGADMKEAMKKMDVDMKKMNEDLKKSLQEINVDKMKQDVDASVAKIDWDKIKAEIEKAKNINVDSMKVNMEEMKENLKKLKPEMEKNLQEARKNVEKAKSDMQEYKNFINGLEQDGLINKKEGYTIEHKEGKLQINGKQQPASVYNKYRTFLEKNKSFTIKKNDEGFDIHNDN